MQARLLVEMVPQPRAIHAGVQGSLAYGHAGDPSDLMPIKGQAAAIRLSNESKGRYCLQYRPLLYLRMKEY